LTVVCDVSINVQRKEVKWEEDVEQIDVVGHSPTILSIRSGIEGGQFAAKILTCIDAIRQATPFLGHLTERTLKWAGRWTTRNQWTRADVTILGTFNPSRPKKTNKRGINILGSRDSPLCIVNRNSRSWETSAFPDADASRYCFH
jgi:hypothetical protein